MMTLKTQQAPPTMEILATSVRDGVVCIQVRRGDPSTAREYWCDTNMHPLAVQKMLTMMGVEGVVELGLKHDMGILAPVEDSLLACLWMNKRCNRDCAQCGNQTYIPSEIDRITLLCPDVRTWDGLASLISLGVVYNDGNGQSHYLRAEWGDDRLRESESAGTMEGHAVANSYVPYPYVSQAMHTLGHNAFLRALLQTEGKDDSVRRDVSFRRTLLRAVHHLVRVPCPRDGLYLRLQRC